MEGFIRDVIWVYCNLAADNYIRKLGQPHVTACSALYIQHAVTDLAY